MNADIKLKQVEAELAQRELELHQSKESLKRFTYAISHELNSPIRMLNSLLDMLDEEHRRQLDDDGTELLDMISVSAQRTQALVSGIIEYSSYCHPDIKHTLCDTQCVLDDALSELAQLIDEKGALVTADPMPWISTSPDALKQLFYQLINNALTYTSQDAQPPTICIHSITSKEGIEFVIEDNGIGIDSKHQERIFKPFERLNPKSEYEGAGLGLSQCLQIVHALKGRIKVGSGEHSGSTFHVFLPQPDNG